VNLLSANATTTVAEPCVAAIHWQLAVSGRMLKGVSRRSPELVDDGRQNGMFRCRAVQPTDRHVPKKDNASNLGVSQTTRVVLYLSVGPAGKDQKGAVDTIPVTATGSSDKTRDKETSTDLTHSHRCATDRYNYPVTFYSLYASTTAALQHCCLTTTEQLPITDTVLLSVLGIVNLSTHATDRTGCSNAFDRLHVAYGDLTTNHVSHGTASNTASQFTPVFSTNLQCPTSLYCLFIAYEYLPPRRFLPPLNGHQKDSTFKSIATDTNKGMKN